MLDYKLNIIICTRFLFYNFQDQSLHLFSAAKTISTELGDTLFHVHLHSFLLSASLRKMGSVNPL